MLTGTFTLVPFQRGFLRSFESLERGALLVAVAVTSEWSRYSDAPLMIVSMTNYLCDDDFVAKIRALVRIREIMSISEGRPRSTFKTFGSHEPSHMTTREAWSRTLIRPPTLGFNVQRLRSSLTLRLRAVPDLPLLMHRLTLENDWGMEPHTAA